MCAVPRPCPMHLVPLVRTLLIRWLHYCLLPAAAFHPCACGVKCAKHALPVDGCTLDKETGQVAAVHGERGHIISTSSYVYSLMGWRVAADYQPKFCPPRILHARCGTWADYQTRRFDSQWGALLLSRACNKAQQLSLGGWQAKNCLS